MKQACRTLMASGLVVLGFGALVALRIGGAPAAIGWAAAAAVCIAVGIATFILVAQQLGRDSKQATVLMLALPVVRIVAAAFLGWLVVGFLPMEAQGSFWISLVAAYLATLTIETGLLARLIRRTANLSNNDVQGAV